MGTTTKPKSENMVMKRNDISKKDLYFTSTILRISIFTYISSPIILQTQRALFAYHKCFIAFFAFFVFHKFIIKITFNY